MKWKSEMNCFYKNFELYRLDILGKYVKVLCRKVKEIFYYLN